ncbi:hypothetical protein [Streptomyces sp. NPDC058294]|uniref:hypothetical protein n=1 Tax=Streptomyces sp. NPDC058294 TaxID=3346430 RepID=UPI0036EEDA0D
MLFIGDDPDTDIFGPQAYGFRPVLLDRDGATARLGQRAQTGVPCWSTLNPLINATFEDGR